MDLSGSFRHRICNSGPTSESAIVQTGDLVAPEVLRRLFDTKFGVWRMSLACDHVELDEAGARLLEVPPLCPLPSDLPQVARFIAPLRQRVGPAGPDRFDLTFPCEMADGKQAWLYVNAVRDELSGTLVGIVKDVTRYKALELEARAAESRLRAILENLPGICYRCQSDPPWRMTFVNSEVEAVTGHCPDAFLEGRIVWEDLILPEDREIVRKEVASAISANRRFDIRYRIKDRAGTVRWVFERGSAQMDEAGFPFEIGGFIFDITEAMQVRHRLQEAEDRYRLVCQSTMDLIYEEDLLLHRVICHSEQETFLGHHLSSIPADSSWWMERVHPEDRPRLLSDITEALAGNSSCFASRHRFERADGSHADMLATAFVQRDLAGKPVRLIGALQDLSRHQAMVAALTASESFSRSIVNASQDCIKMLDLEGRLLFINAYGLEAMGLADAKSVIGRTLLSFWPRDSHRRIRKALDKARAGGTGHFVGQCRMPDGKMRAWDVLVSPLDSGNGQPDRLLAISRDITERLETERRLMEAATIDPLTGLPNRRYFLHQLGESIANAAVRGDLIGILILDLDGFKQINDTMGHDAGDAMLRTVAQRLEQFAGPEVICARLAGDEFAVIVRAIRSGDDLVDLGKAILGRLKEPFLHADRMLDGHASIGAAVWPLDGKSVSELLKSADLALYAAKKERPGSVQRFIPEHRRDCAHARPCCEERVRPCAEMPYNRSTSRSLRSTVARSLVTKL